MDETLVNTVQKGGGSGNETPVATPQLYLLMESRRPLESSSRHALGNVDEVVIGRGKTRAYRREIQAGARRLIIQIPDRWMSSVHARIDRRGTQCILHDANSTNGSMVNGVETKSATLKDGDIVELGQTFFLFRSDVPTALSDPADLHASELRAPTGLVSLLPGLLRQFAELVRVVKAENPIVLLGESGTGKEVTAQAVHELSERSGKFVPVNCGALPDTLVESSFFGHKRGSFSGATEDREGWVVAANRGTLFLDEIGDLPLISQAALLRVLQERKVTPVGSTNSIPVDFRLVSATHRELDKLVAKGAFREDLMARLAGFEVHLPSLAQRLEDIGVLIATLLPEAAGSRDPAQVQFSNEAVRALLAYPWPRNIRELQMCLKTAIALSQGELIEVRHLSPRVRSGGEDDPEEGDREPGKQSRSLSPEQAARRDQIDKLLAEHKGNISAVARAMGKVRSQVQRWIKSYGLDPASYRDT